jgi:hypothetical protein
VSQHNSSLALEEVVQPLEKELKLYIPARFLKPSSDEADRQSMIVKVSGTITVSF